MRDILVRSKLRRQPAQSAPQQSAPLMPPLPPAPEIYKPEIQVEGASPQIARAVWATANRHPDAKKNVRRVVAGPTPGLLDIFNMVKMPIQHFDKTNLKGLFEEGSRDVFVNPSVPLADNRGDYVTSLVDVLAHEFAHARGADEPGARLVDSTIPPAEFAAIARASRPRKRGLR